MSYCPQQTWPYRCGANQITERWAGLRCRCGCWPKVWRLQAYRGTRLVTLTYRTSEPTFSPPPLPVPSQAVYSGDKLNCTIGFIMLPSGDVAQEVRAVVWQLEGCRFDPTLGVSKCPWARHLTPNCSWRAGWCLAWQPIAVGVWVCVWMGEWEA